MLELPEQLLRTAAYLTIDAPAFTFWSADGAIILRRAAELRCRLTRERGRVLDDKPEIGRNGELAKAL